MMRIEGVPEEAVPEKVAHIYRKALDRYGRVPTPLTALAHCPDVLETLTALSGALTNSQTVEPRLKTLACLRAAQIAGCPF
jgi:alkylhydroperoxidase family enzyme